MTLYNPSCEANGNETATEFQWLFVSETDQIAN
jgi:hypothetical protein